VRNAEAVRSDDEHLYLFIIVLCGELWNFAALTRYVRDFAVRKGWVKPPVLVRHIHQHAVPRVGGVAIFLSVMAVFVVTLLSAEGRAQWKRRGRGRF